MSDNGGIYTNVGFTVDNASVARAKAAVADVKGAINKASSEAKNAALGASTLQVELGKLSRADQLKSVAAEMGTLAAKTNDVGGAVSELQKKLKALGASDDEIKGVAGTFQDAAQAAGQASSGNRLTKIGASIRNLPSVQIPGLGIGTDAIGNLLRVSGALKEMSDKAALARTAADAAKTAEAAKTAATVVATGASEGQAVANTQVGASSLIAAAGVAALEASMAPLLVIGGAVAILLAGIAIAAKIAADGLAGANDDLKASYDAARKIQEFVRSGATSEEAQARLDEIQATLDDERANLANAKADYAEAFNAAANSIPIIGDLFARIADLFGAFRATKDEMGTAEKAVKENEKAQGALSKALDTGKFAAADAKKAAEERADAESKAADESARAVEKAASEKERSEQKAAQAAEQAAQKIEQAQKAIAKATVDFSNKQADIARQSTNKINDLRQAARDKEQVTDRKYFNDLIKLTEKSNFDRLEAQYKAAAAEEQAVRDTNRKLEDLRDEAIENETQAVNDRNFLAAAKVRESLERANKDTLKEADRAKEDRASAAQEDERARLAQLEEARKERRDAYRQEQFDNRENLKIQIRDARTAKDRQLEEARAAYDRELATQNAFLSQMGAANAAFYQQQVNTAQQAAGAANGASGGASVPLGGGGGIGSFPGGYSFPAGGSMGGLRPIPGAPSIKAGNNINLTIYAPDEQAIYNGVKRLGLVD